MDECRSPCVRNCCLDEHDVCLGCGRTLHEIKAWHDAKQPQRLAILERSRQRLARRQFPFNRNN
ncbi:hypothetical protein HR45_04290 [Shewanella mangrovi]|uniref:DUF1289 domain-containing protein n=1 Tax=Shewanella mangrovi TaxID=1515746 RepID=A0A094JFC3_9GAMM|nr:hypothetical protein HR45_04290 [Shewanella mangrovi]